MNMIWLIILTVTIVLHPSEPQMQCGYIRSCSLNINLETQAAAAADHLSGGLGIASSTDVTCIGISCAFTEGGQFNVPYDNGCHGNTYKVYLRNGTCLNFDMGVGGFGDLPAGSMIVLEKDGINAPAEGSLFQCIGGITRMLYTPDGSGTSNTAYTNNVDDIVEISCGLCKNPGCIAGCNCGCLR